MIETYFMGTYWGARQEDAAACAQRLLTLVRLLEPVDPLFARWFQGARSRKKSLERPLETELPRLQQYIQRKILRDSRRKPMEQAGFSFGLWNGAQGGNDAWLSIYCGEYSEWVGNRCVLNAPYEGPGSERVLTAAFQAQALRALAIAWDPDWGVGISDDHREMIDRKFPDVWVGWLTYLSRRQGRVPPLPAPVRIEPVEELGALVILTPERFTASNPEHVALSERVGELLNRAGLLKSARPQRGRTQ